MATIADPILAGAPNPLPYDEVPADAPDFEEQAQSILDRLQSLANEQVRLKNPIEERWLKNMRSYHGFYEPTTEADLKEAGQARNFVKITGAKTRAMKARLFDLLFPTDDKNWSIEPTPVPKLAKEISEAEATAKQAADLANRAAAAGDAVTEAGVVAAGDEQASRALAAREEVARMEKAADLMETEMDDQLVESRYPSECRTLIDDACKIGTGILKGPVVYDGGRGRWLPQQGQDGAVSFALTPYEDVRPKHKRTDPWSFFPDMAARSPEEWEFTFERYLWNKKQLRQMVKTHGFSPNAVRRILEEKSGALGSIPAGLQYLTQLREIAKGDGVPIKGRFVGWEYHGQLETEEVATLLRALGKEELAMEYVNRNDPLDEVNVVVWFCEGELLKIAPEYPMDSGETLYSIFNLVEADESVFGYGIPHLIEDDQDALNAAWRMGIDNSAYSVKPQVVIDKTMIEPADGDWNMAPGKAWLKVGKPVGTEKNKPVEFFNVPNNMAEIGSIIEMAMQFIDIESGIPMPQQGEQGATTTQTVGGMAILQNAANIVFRAIVKNFDDGIITPTMRRLYDWNMQHNPRDDIKGDMQIDARGSSVLLVKEVQAQNLMVIVTSLMANPTFAMMMKPYPAIQKLFQAMMIRPADVMLTEDEYDEAVKAAQEQEQPQDPVIVTAQARIQSAQIMADSRKTSDEVQLMIEQMRQETRVMELGDKFNLTIEEIKAQLGKVALTNESKERMFAAEVGAERVFADEARARGEDPSGSGGFVSAGGEPEKVDA